jgi:hypothetical protein
MLKQIIVTLDTSDPLQAQLLVEYLASNDRVRFGRCCMLLGYLAGTQPHPSEKGPDHASVSPESAAPALAPKVGLTLEDLGVGISPADQKAQSDPLSTQHLESESPTAPSLSPFDLTPNDSVAEVKTATKPKIGGGLFGLD